MNKTKLTAALLAAALILPAAHSRAESGRQTPGYRAHQR